MTSPQKKAGFSKIMAKEGFSLIFLVDRIKDFKSTKFQNNCMIFNDLRDLTGCLYICNDVITIRW